MKITESTSISLKLIIAVMPFILGFGGWMYRIDTSVTGLRKSMSSVKKILHSMDNKIGAVPIEEVEDDEYVEEALVSK